MWIIEADKLLKKKELHVEKKDLLKVGKVKSVFRTDNADEVIIEFRDDATAFGGIKKAIIEGKGVLNSRISTILYHHLMNNGIKTHFIKNLDERRQLCHKVDMIPLEFTCRNIVAGNMARRLGLEEGAPLDAPILEICFKNDELNDPLLNDAHAYALNLIKKDQLEYCYNQLLKINDLLKDLFEKVDIKLVNFKLEFGVNGRGEVILADEIGPDSCRLWEATTNTKLDKDVFRKDLGDILVTYQLILDRLETLGILKSSKGAEIESDDVYKSTFCSVGESKGIISEEETNKSARKAKNSYSEAGVNVEAGYESVELIKKHVASTKNLGAISDIGGFGALFDISKYHYKHPILVSGTDGVGTKLEVANELGVFNTIGIDLVAMCVNDIAAVGAKPLYFLDYIAVDVNRPKKIEQIVAGICQGLRECDCALIGGETAEMPGVYHEDGFDLAGFATGIVEKDEIIDFENVEVGQVIIGLPSSGLHSNGFSLVRKIIKEKDLKLGSIYPELSTEKTLGEIILEPTKIYVNEILNLTKHVDIKGVAHITGGGFYENIKRITGKYGALINTDQLKIPSIFSFLEHHGNLDFTEMFGYFNMGIGMVCIVDEGDVKKALELLDGAYVIGNVSSNEDIRIFQSES